MEFKHNSFTTSVCTAIAVSTVVFATTFATKHINQYATSTSSSLATKAVPIAPLPRTGQVLHTSFPRTSRLSVKETGFQSTPSPTVNFVQFALAGSLAIVSFFVVLWRKNSIRSPFSMAAVAGTRPTLADTKLRFLTLCDLSIPNMYSIPLQELLAQHHLIRFSSKYQYDEVFALGIFTVINQLLEGLPEADSERIQTAYFSALDDNFAKFKADATELELWASSKGKELNLSGSDDVTTKLKAVATRAAGGDFQYSKFFSIGLFQLLQQSGQTDPESFTQLVNGMNLDKERVTKDLKIYKDLLKRLEMAKDMKEKFLERERKKQEERQAQKAKPAEV
eukprot:EG_transcript_17545